jgi:hypothetical protein
MKEPSKLASFFVRVALLPMFPHLKPTPREDFERRWQKPSTVGWVEGSETHAGR